MSEPWQAEVNTALRKASDVLRQKQRHLDKRIKQQEEREATTEREAKRRRVEILADVEQQRQELEEEKMAMKDVHKFQSSQVTLDVGGIRYKTSRSTLTKVPNTMLAAMFSGRHELIRNEDGAYFIDRDGTHFRYVLNYLRDRDTSNLPTDTVVLEDLLKEADFYQVERLSACINYLLRPFTWYKPMSQKEIDNKSLNIWGPKEGAFTSDNGHTFGAEEYQGQWNLDRKFIINVSFSGAIFRERLSFKNSVLRNVTFRHCCFQCQPDFTKATMTNVSFQECQGLTENMPLMARVKHDGVTFDVPELNDKLLF